MLHPAAADGGGAAHTGPGLPGPREHRRPHQHVGEQQLAPPDRLEQPVGRVERAGGGGAGQPRLAAGERVCARRERVCARQVHRQTALEAERERFQSVTEKERECEML